jgi:CTP synthase (UTP-ammonia lyase)
VLVEYARNVAGIEGAGHAELDPDGETLVVAPLACSLVGETRLVRTVPRTRAAAICGEAPMPGYHFCSYGLAAEWRPALEAAGLVFSGCAEDGTAEIVELPDHPFFMATLFQPQVAPDEASKDSQPHPLLVAFATAVAL